MASGQYGTRDNPRTTWDIIVIGAGVSGMAAAAHLTKQGRRVLVLESRDRIGGRIYSQNIGSDGHKVDIGASYVHGVHDNPVHDLVTELNIVSSRALWVAVDSAASSGQRQRSEQLRFQGPVESDVMSTIANNVIGSFFDEAREFSAHNDPPADASLASYLYRNGTSLYDGVKSTVDQERARMFTRSLAGWTGAELEEVSLKWWGFERDTLGADRLVSRGSYVQVVEHLAKGCAVELDSEVIGVQDDGCNVRVITRKAQYSARHVICTLPLGVLKASTDMFAPRLPPRKLAAIERVGFGLLSKVALRYPTAWWKERISGTGMLLLPMADTPEELQPPFEPRLLPRSIMVQNFDRIEGAPHLVAFFGASWGQAVERCDPSAVTEWLDRLIKRFIAPDEIDLPLPVEGGALVTKWSTDPFSRGAYSYIPVGNAVIDTAPSPLDMAEFAVPIWGGKLGFAGEHTHCDRYASVHGAYESGIREAKRIDVELGQVNEADPAGSDST